MEYKCPICHDYVAEDLHQYIDHTEKHIIEVIKEKHPEWIEQDGVCQKCFEYYKKEMTG